MESNQASSKEAETGSAEAGRSMRRMRAERALGGAWMGPVARRVQEGEEVGGLSEWAMAEPEASSEGYQEMRMKASPGPSRRA